MEERRCIKKDSAELRREIEETKSSLSEHLHELEEEVRESVDKVKGSFGASIKAFKNIFHIRDKVREHPEMAMGISMLVGLGISQLRGAPERGKEATPEFLPYSSGALPSRRRRHGALSFLRRHFKQELRNLSVLGAGMLINAARDWMQEGRGKTASLPDNSRQEQSYEDGSLRERGMFTTRSIGSRQGPRSLIRMDS